MIKGFLFDLDGVIVETAIFHYQAWRKMANDLGFDISEEFNEGLKGVSRMDSLDLILEPSLYKGKISQIVTGTTTQPVLKSASNG